MKPTKLILLTFGILLISFNNKLMNKEKKAEEKTKIIKAYFNGWANKDWNAISTFLAPGFTFTSPAGDDHLSTEKFKEKCWIQSDNIQKFDFLKIIEEGDEAFVMYRCTTKENTSFRNTEYFTFSDGKVKAIEVFFGTGGGFPTNAK